MRNKLQQFMQGRYGFDQLYRVLVLAAVVCTLLSSMLRKSPAVSNLLYFASVALIVWAFYRALSRNIEKRYLENLHYLERMGSVGQRARMSREKMKQRKEYKFFVCPTCKTNLRVPKGKGKVNITCSKCGTRFQGNGLPDSQGNDQDRAWL